VKLSSFCSVVLISGIGHRIWSSDDPLSSRKSLMVRTVFILLWDYKYRRGLSDDICLFSAPIPTSTFIRVVLCIPGMACHDITWPHPSIRWKRGGYSSHLMCRQRATRNRAAMRAAYLVLMALGEDKMSLQSLECLLCHVWHLNIPLTCLVAYCILIGSWVTLGLICRLTIFLVGKRILSMVMGFF